MEKAKDKFVLLSKIVRYLLPVLAIAGVTAPLVIGKSNLSLLGSYLVVPMILASIVYIKQNKYENSCKMLDNKLFSLFISIYIIFISISIYFLHIYSIRPMVYYLTVVAAFTTILLEILLFDINKKNERAILLQISILIVSIIWGVSIKYNFFIGRTDIIVHAWYIGNLINTGHVTRLFDIYTSFPLWHILCTFVYEVTGTSLSIQKTMSLTNGLIYGFIPIATYLLSIKLFKDRKISLLTALFVSLYPDIIFYGMYSIPRSVVSFLEVMLILVLIDATDPKKVVLSIIFTLSIIIFHTASMPFIILILLLIPILRLIGKQENYEPFLPLGFLIFTVCITIFYWTYYAPILLFNIINNLITPAPIGLITESIVITPFNELFNYLQYSPLLFFIIIGFFGAMNSKKISPLGKLFCILGLLVVPITFPGPSLLFNKLSSNFNMDRFGEYSFLFLVLVGAIGFYELYKRQSKILKIFSIIVFVTFAFLSVSNDFNASDNPLVKRPFYTFYLTDQEEMNFLHLASISQGYLMSDFVTDRYLSNSKYVNTTHIIEIDSKKMQFLRNINSDVFLIRESELSKRPLKLFSSSDGTFLREVEGSENFIYYFQDSKLWADLEKYNKIYDSKSILGFN